MVPLLVGGVCGRGRGVCDLLMRFCTQASFKRPIQKGLGGELRGIRRIALSRGYTLQVWEGFFFFLEEVGHNSSQLPSPRPPAELYKVVPVETSNDVYIPTTSHIGSAIKKRVPFF